MTDPHSMYTPIEAEADQKYHPQAESVFESGTAPPPTELEEALKQEKPRSLTSDALRDLRRNPIFIISAVIIVILVVMAAFPGLFTSKDPTVLRPEPDSAGAQRRRMVRLRRAGLRRLRPHDLRSPRLDLGRPRNHDRSGHHRRVVRDGCRLLRRDDRQHRVPGHGHLLWHSAAPRWDLGAYFLPVDAGNAAIGDHLEGVTRVGHPGLDQPGEDHALDGHPGETG